MKQDWPTRREFKAIVLISVFFGGLAFSFYFSGIHLGPGGSPRSRPSS